MTRREYGQPCSVACALDQIGERWSLLIVRELLLGPLRFSELARAVGGAPTDVLTKRLRDLEERRIVRRRELEPPASAIAYELTELGRELERPLLELGRWGLNFHDAASDRRDAAPSMAAQLAADRPPAPRGGRDESATAQRGHSFRLEIAGGRIERRRREAAAPDLTIAGTAPPFSRPGRGEEAEDDVEISGDREALETLPAMILLPELLREDALSTLGGGRRRRYRS